MRTKIILTSLFGCFALHLAVSQAVSAADLISAQDIRKTLSGRQLTRQQQLFQQLKQIQKLDAAQSVALAEVADGILKSKQPVTLSGLQTVYFLRRATGPETEAVLLKALEYPDPRVAMLAMDALAVLKPEAAQSKLIEQRAHQWFPQSYAFRRSLVDAVAAYANASAVTFLIDLLPSIDGQLEFLTVQHLMQLSGQNFANDSKKWKEWWLAESGSYRGPPATSKPDEQVDAQKLAANWNQKLPEFYEVPLFAKKIVFLIDNSKSMLSTKDNVTRLEKAQEELTEAILAMAEDVEFNIIAYNDNLDIWQSQLVPASAAAKSDASQFTNSLAAFGRTASYDALSRGLEFDPNTELLVYLSDGKPTVGKIVDPFAIVTAITEQNMFQKTTIDTLGIDTEGDSERFMLYLANDNFGTYHKIR
jgi:von Willebrand factor type A domain